MERYFNQGPQEEEEILLTPDNFKSSTTPPQSTPFTNSPINLLDLLAKKDGFQQDSISSSKSVPNLNTQDTQSLPHFVRSQSTSKAVYSNQSNSNTPTTTKSPGRKYSISVSPGRSAISSLNSSSPEERFSGAAYLSSPAPSALPLPLFNTSGNSVLNQPNFNDEPELSASGVQNLENPNRPPKLKPKKTKKSNNNKAPQNNNTSVPQSPNRQNIDHHHRSKSSSDVFDRSTQFAFSPISTPIRNRNNTPKNRNDNNFEPNNPNPNAKSIRNIANSNNHLISQSTPNLLQQQQKQSNQNNMSHSTNNVSSSVDKPDSNNDYDNMSQNLKMMLNICSA